MDTQNEGDREHQPERVSKPYRNNNNNNSNVCINNKFV